MNFTFDVNEVENNVYMITAEGGNNEYYKMMIYTWDDPYTVFYAGGNTPEDREGFEKLLFEKLEADYPDCF